MNLLPGTILGQRYRIDALLGEGGMGAVYHATDWRGAGCALKVLRPEYLGSPDIWRRFEQEAQIGLRLRHPHVRQIWDAAVDPYTRLPYLAMELLSGEDLAARVGWRGSLRADEVAVVFRQLCDALSTAHAAGVVHRDLKPENLFLAATPAGGEVLKVLDFGIAKVLTAGPAQSSQVIGTPSWMAPEQLGVAANIGPATDVWALGLLAFYLLTGRAYWPSANTSPSSYGNIIVEILDKPARVAASRRAAEYGCAERIPHGFDAWFARCTRNTPENRYPDVTSCWEALRAVLSTAPAATPTIAAAPASFVLGLSDEDALVERVTAEVGGRLPAALAAAAAELSTGRTKVPLHKRPTPVPPAVAAVVSTPAHLPAVILDPRLPAGMYPTPAVAIAPWAVPASKAHRVVSASMDALVAAFSGFVTGVLFQAANGAWILGVIAFFVVLWLRDVIGGGRSLGKRALGLRIIDLETGRPIGLHRAFVRQIFCVGGLPVINALGGVLVDSVLLLSRGDGRHTGDLVAGTQVVERSTQ